MKGQHKRLMKIFAPAIDEETVRILHAAASNCESLLSDMNVKRVGLLLLLWRW